MKKTETTKSYPKTKVHYKATYKGTYGLLNDYKGAIYIECGVCGKDFKSFQAWHKHVTKVETTINVPISLI